jgi:hypothetical protein
MPDIIEENRKPSFLDSLGIGLSNAGQAYGQYKAQSLVGQHQKKEQERLYNEENAAAKKLGVDLAGIRTPGLRQQALKSTLEGNFKNEKTKNEKIEDKHRSDVIRKYYGDEEADKYEAASEGGKTAITRDLIERSNRNNALNTTLAEQGVLNEEEEIEPREKLSFIDFDKGLTPRERVRREESRYGINLPLFQASIEKKRALDSEKDHLNILEELSPQIGTIERLNINPQSGELFIPGLASPEAQRYVKTLNDFTTNAKDSYGARVTNFDLQQFMRRLPTLANSEEGRAQILKQMQIINEINSTREQVIQDIIDQHGGIRKIDYDKAERMAEKKSAGRTAQLKGEFRKIDANLEKQYQAKVKEQKAIIPKDHVGVQKADGTTGYIPKDNLKKFLEVPGNKAL